MCRGSDIGKLQVSDGKGRHTTSFRCKRQFQSTDRGAECDHQLKGVYTGKAANGWTFLHTKTTNGFSGFVKFNSSSKVVCLSVKLESALIIASVFKSVSTRALLTSENLGRYYPEQGVKCVLVFPENEIETEIALNLKEKLESGSQISFPTVILPLPKGFKNWLSVYLGSAGSSAFPTIQILN